MAFVLTTAIFKNGGRESRKIQKIVYLKFLSHTTYINKPQFSSLDETVINIRRIMILKPVAKIIPKHMLPLHMPTHY